jgi:hypothetical protein
MRTPPRRTPSLRMRWRWNSTLCGDRPAVVDSYIWGLARAASCGGGGVDWVAASQAANDDVGWSRKPVAAVAVFGDFVFGILDRVLLH